MEKMHFKLSLFIVWIALWIVNTYSELQVNILSNNRDTVLQNGRVFVRRRLRQLQVYSNTSGLKTAELKKYTCSNKST